MTPSEFLHDTLSEVCPGTYVAYRKDRAPEPPWFVYKRRNGTEVFADNQNYAALPRYRVELLFRENDPDLVARFEAALSRLGTWRLYDADYLDSEGCIMHDYRLSVDLSKLREREVRDA